MLQLKPGDTIILTIDEKSIPATVEEIRWQHTRNGEAAIAVVLEYGEAIKTRVLQLVVEEGISGYLDGDIEIDCAFRTFLTKDVTMADQTTIDTITERLRIQRESMRVSLTQSVVAPRVPGGATSTSTRERQKERAKEKRASERNMFENAIDAYMGENKCTREEAIAFFEAKAKGST